MVTVRLSRLFAAFAFAFACAGFFLVSCATPEFKFVDNNQPSHCTNLQRDEGESDVDCGGACAPCSLTQLCNTSSDCRDSECIDGICQAASCSDGSQTESETDVDCGGGSCKGCPVGGGCSVGTDCVSGVCGETGCAAPTCGDRVPNGNESDIDCGGMDCSQCVAGQKCLIPSDCVGNECTAGVCALSCAAGTANCDGDSSNGCETNLRTDSDHCGDCETTCALDNATASCSAGVCRVESCVAPYGDCNGDPSDGCETNTTSSLSNCGVCDSKPCPTLNGSPYCSDSKCELTCDKNFADCDGEAGNGCEKDVSRDINNCGGCGKTCTASAGKTAWCRDGQCGETTCAAGRGDCNGDPDDDPANNGCETDLKTDVDSCGTCGNICGVANGTAQCAAGVCSIKSCASGFDDCTGGYADGCETKTTTDLTNCGACGRTCTAANGTPACVSGGCQVKTCTGTYADCNGSATDGCETNTATSQTHCGACTGDSVNCDTLFPHSGGQCTNSVCTLKPSSCATDYANCNSVPSDGCESNLKTDVNHCGACPTACSTTGTNSTSCAAGVCSPQCKGALLSCSNPQNGCTIDGATDENNCGGCSKVCLNTSAAHVDSSGNQCLSGKCNPSCANLYDDCDNNPNNGCEKSVATDLANCGACNVSCGSTNTTASPTCSSGSCNFQCQAGWAACGAPSAGCATQLGTLSNCTECGDACTGAMPQFCTAAGCSGHLDIGVMGTPVSVKASFQSSTVPKLSVTHTLTNSKAAGRYRLVLVGVSASEPYHLSTKTVTYANAVQPVMHLAVEAKTTGTPASYVAIYYLQDDELPLNAGSNTVTVQLSDSGQNGSGAFTVSEFQNVRQTPGAPTPFPFVITSGSPNGASCGNPSVRSVALNFSQAGSFGYAVLGARQGSSATAVAGTVTETMNLLQPEPGPMMGLAGYVGPINGNSTLSWNVSNCSNSAGVGVVLKRIGD